jgi:hypothetical protein
MVSSRINERICAMRAAAAAPSLAESLHARAVLHCRCAVAATAAHAEVGHPSNSVPREATDSVVSHS